MLAIIWHKCQKYLNQLPGAQSEVLGDQEWENTEQRAETGRQTENKTRQHNSRKLSMMKSRRLLRLLLQMLLVNAKRWLFFLTDSRACCGASKLKDDPDDDDDDDDGATWNLKMKWEQ